MEAALGTMLVIAMITSFANVQQDTRNGQPFAVSSVNAQLDSLQDLGVVQDIVKEKNASKLEDELEVTGFDINASIQVKDHVYNATTEADFTESFNYGSRDVNAELFLWGDGQQVSVDLNGNEVYSSGLEFDRVSLDPSSGTNTLSFDNAGGRVAYLVSVTEDAGDSAPDADEVYVIRRIFKPGPVDSSEVFIYLWR
ncbi:MAG: hypothetical protein ABEJ36_04810, partial [Candidatus Nanosalina sp.]